MGRRALFERYISGLKGKKEERHSGVGVRWITFESLSSGFTEANLTGFLGVHGIEISMLCKVLVEQAAIYKSSQVLSVKIEMVEDRTFRVFLGLPDGFFKSDLFDNLQVCKYAVVGKRCEIRKQGSFLSFVRFVLNKGAFSGKYL